MKIDKKYTKIAAIIVGVLLLVGLIGWNRFEAWYSGSLDARSSEGQDVTFVVESGQTPEEIAKNLLDAGLIKSDKAFTIYLGRTGKVSSLQAGTYRLNPAMSTEDIVDIISNGKVDTRLFTIVPGLRLAEVKQALIDAGFDSSEVESALKATYSSPVLADKPKSASLEGYIYPESIQVDSTTSVEYVLKQSFEVFWDNVTDDIKAGIEKQGLTFHEAVILASIVAQESYKLEDQDRMARVFYNRLAADMPLGSDVTFIYAAKEMGVEPSINLDSPYNTRINKGLPPGPISNFGIEALRAVAFPAEGDWLYFVAGDDGITRFANTLEEHEDNTAKYCKELCEL
jgi:UPF0755 protein